MKMIMNNLGELKGAVIAVTGAGGYIGSQIVKAFSGFGVKILCVSRNQLSISGENEWIKGDISDYELWLRIITQAKIVFHLAGNTSAHYSERDVTGSLNATVLPIGHIINAAKNLGKYPKIIFASTATIYGLTNELPVAESAHVKPITFYDLHKYFAEMQLMLATKQGILEATSLRLSNVYGPSDSKSSSLDRGILNKISLMALEGKKLNIYGDGDYTRDYIFISDVINAFIITAATSDLSGSVYNIGSGAGTTVKKAFEYAINMAENVTGAKVELAHVPWASDIHPIEKRNFIADISKFREATGWHPEVNIKSGLKILINSYNEFLKTPLNDET